MSKIVLFVFLFTALSLGSALAAPTCMTDTLASYINLGATGCEIGATTFAGFQALSPITGALAIAPGSISITPVQSGNTVGLDLVFDATATAGQLQQALIGYLVVAPGLTSSAVTLSGASAGGGAFATDIQNLCIGGTFLAGDVTGCNGFAEDSLVVLNSGSQQTTFPAVSTVGVVHDFTLDAFEGGTATGGMVMDRFTLAADPQAIPEPQTYVLLSSAVLALALRARSRSRAQSAVQTGGER